MTRMTEPTEGMVLPVEDHELTGARVTKAHGTGNDFVVFTDPDGTRDVSPRTVAAVCHRHLGLGGDGLIRAVRSEHVPEGRELLHRHPGAEWFMDYRNADGSVAQMCGNGVRVFVDHLVREGLVRLPRGARLQIGTRAGVRTVARTSDGYAVDMGPWSFSDGDSARERGSDSVVTAQGLRVPRPGLSIGMGNPHTVVALSEGEKLDGLDLHSAPSVDPVPPEGTNVEFVVPLDHDDSDVGRLEMRVHERGVGETFSCGTGACAAAAATRWPTMSASTSWAAVA